MTISLSGVHVLVDDPDAALSSAALSAALAPQCFAHAIGGVLAELRCDVRVALGLAGQ